MPTHQQPDTTRQNIQNVGKNATQVGGNYTHTSSININLLISIFFISLVAFGGLAWALNAGIKPTGDSQLIESTENKTP
ncbi:MAG: hypothetical protein HC800_22465 [Phormidesmis sp. RL_2_1]|nr:hypothetical protein [Phormidesmis sp. RL_2_1]